MPRIPAICDSRVARCARAIDDGHTKGNPAADHLGQIDPADHARDEAGCGVALAAFAGGVAQRGAAVSARRWREWRIRCSRRTGSDVAPPRKCAEGRADRSLIASDRGLCGGYNANLMRVAERKRCRAAERRTRAEALRRRPKRRSIISGARGSRSRRRASEQCAAGSRRSASRGSSRRGCCRITQSGAIAEAAIVYSQFRSAISLRPVYERLLPVAKPPRNKRSRLPQPIDYLVEPSPPNWCR